MKNQTIKLVVISLIVMLALSACGAISDVKQAGDAFMMSFRDNKPSDSWGMLVADVQNEVGSEQAWAEFVAPRSFNNWKFSNTQITNDVAQMDGEAKLGADTYDITLVFEKENDMWKISGVNFTYQE